VPNGTDCGLMTSGTAQHGGETARRVMRNDKLAAAAWVGEQTDDGRYKLALRPTHGDRNNVSPDCALAV